MKNYVYQSILSSEMEQLVRSKRAMGYKYQTGANQLQQLDRFLTEENLMKKELSKELFDKWSQRRNHESRQSQSHRISIFRVLAKYLTEHDMPSYIPKEGAGTTGPKYEAHIYSVEELKAFFLAASQLRPSPAAPFRHLTIPVIFKLLYTSGFRIGELLTIKVKDFDSSNETIRIIDGKNGKSRIVPINPSVAKDCRALKLIMHKESKDDDFFFYKSPGKPMEHAYIYYAFRDILEKAGIPHRGKGKGPRIHDFRHTFACNVLLQWSENDVDLIANIPYLKTILGHETFKETAYYLKLTSQVFSVVRTSVENCFPNIIEELDLNEDSEFY